MLKTTCRDCYQILRTPPRSTISECRAQSSGNLSWTSHTGELGAQPGGNPDLCSCYEMWDLKVSTNHVISLFQTFCL